MIEQTYEINYMSESIEGAQKLLTIAEAAALLNVSKMTIRRWTNSGKLACSRIGPRKERRFLRTDLQKLLSADEPNVEQASGSIACDRGEHRCVICDDSMRGWQAIVDEVVAHRANGSHITFVGNAERYQRLADSVSENGEDFQEISDGAWFRSLSVEASYLLSGQFSGERAAAFVESSILYAKSLGFERSLFVGWSDWVAELAHLGKEKVMAEVIEYERNLDVIISRHPHATVLCPYSFENLTAQTLSELSSFHAQIQFQSQRVFELNH